MQNRIVLAVLIALFAILVGPAYADVSGMLGSATSSVIGWVRVAGALIIIFFGLRMMSGHMNLMSAGGLLVGLAIAMAPQEILSWMG